MENMPKLDKKDKRILYQLELNSRQTNTKIAKKVGLSKDVINYRIKRLEEERFINGYYTIIDFYQLGYFSIRVYLKLMKCKKIEEDKLIDFLIKSKNVFYVIKLDGNFDIGFGTWIKSIYDFESFYIEFKRHFKKYIGKENVSIFTKVYHFHRAYLLDKKEDESDYNTFGGGKPEKYDQLDLDILRMLASNARMPITEIAKKLKIPIMTISFRIKQLEKKKIIQSYRINFDFSKFGYDYYRVDLILDDVSRIKELVHFAHMNPNIVYVDQTIGGSDFEFDVEVKNREEFLKLMDELKEKFPEIREWNYFNVREYKKLLYFLD